MTRRYTSHVIRELLRENLEGLTKKVLREHTKQTESNLRRVLKGMPDVYIDRWEPAPRGQWAAVFCCQVPPPDCPKPTKRVK